MAKGGNERERVEPAGRLSKAQTVAFISLVWFGSQWMALSNAFQTFQSMS